MQHCQVKGFEILGERAWGRGKYEIGAIMVLAPNYSRMIIPAPLELKLESHARQDPLHRPGRDQAGAGRCPSAGCVAPGSVQPSLGVSGCLASLPVLRAPANPQASDALGLLLHPLYGPTALDQATSVVPACPPRMEAGELAPSLSAFPTPPP